MHTNSLPGTFAEAQTFADQVSQSTEAALRDGDPSKLLAVTQSARLAVRARGASVLEVASPADSDAIRSSVFEVADAADQVAAGTAEVSTLDAAMIAFLGQVGHLQDDLIQSDASAFRRLRGVTMALVGVLALGAAIAAIAMLYSDRAWALARSKERAVAQLVDEQNRELAELVRRDLLTGLLNRSALLTEFAVPQDWLDGRSTLGVVYVDLDRSRSQTMRWGTT
jgi:hypothetical protein